MIISDASWRKGRTFHIPMNNTDPIGSSPDELSRGALGVDRFALPIFAVLGNDFATLLTTILRKSSLATDAYRVFLRPWTIGGADSDSRPDFSAATSPSRIVSAHALAIVCPQHWGGSASSTACSTRPQEMQW